MSNTKRPFIDPFRIKKRAEHRKGKKLPVVRPRSLLPDSGKVISIGEYLAKKYPV